MLRHIQEIPTAVSGVVDHQALPPRGARISIRAAYALQRKSFQSNHQPFRKDITLTTSEAAVSTETVTTPVPVQMGELVLKTGRFEAMHGWYSHLLGHGAFYERTPEPDAPPRPAGMPERAVDVRLAFFQIHESEHPHNQVLGLFGMESLIGVEPKGPGLHHFQFSVDSLDDLFTQYAHMLSNGAAPHRTANHGQATSFYYRDPDGNIIEFTTSNFATLEGELEFMASPAFAANPSGLELDAEDFAARHRSGESRESLLSLDPPEQRA